jgi:hypothetical protein
MVGHDLSHQSKYNNLELKIRGVIITRKYLLCWCNVLR